MLVATPANAGMADRKPKVISGLKKTHVQRSPSLDGLPRLSGILNHYSESDKAWFLRWVVVRDGSLLVYAPDKDPGVFGCATLSRLERVPNVDKCFPSVTVCTGNEMMQSLDSSVLRRELHINEDNASKKNSTETDLDKIDTPKARMNLDQMLRRDQAIFDSAMTPFGTNSLGRNGTSGGTGASCARLPLRHLNLRPCDLRPLAFSLSRRVEGGQPCTVATFQAPSRRDYERWVKTLAVEILRQTPLDAVRFLDILGIAAFDDDKTKHDVRSSSADQVDFADHTPIRPARMSRKAMFASAETAIVKKSDTAKKATFKASPFDRSKSGSIKKHRSQNSPRRDRNRNSFRKKDKTDDKKVLIVNGEHSKRNDVARNLFVDKSRIPLLTCESIVNRDNITTVTIGEIKDTRGREVFTPPYSREADIHTDEGIVVEISDDDLSCESDLKTRRLSEHSNCLDSPKSCTSQSSFGDSATPSVDCLDGFDDRIIKINIPHAVSISKRKKDEINKRRTEVDRHNAINKDDTKETIEHANNWGRESAVRVPWVGFVLKPAGIDQLLAKDSAEKVDIGRSPQIFSGRWSWENSAVYNQMTYPDRMFMRARSCSPNKKAFGGAPRRYAASCGRPGRLSAGHLARAPEDGEETVQLLKMRCQSTDKYVPVREKLALFETLSQVERRLARSSEDLLKKHASDSLPVVSKRAHSLHDLTKPDVPSVPVKEMCKFFESMSKDKPKSLSAPGKLGFKQRKSEFPIVNDNTSNGFTSMNNAQKLDTNDNFDRLNYVMCRQIKNGNKIISFL